MNVALIASPALHDKVVVVAEKLNLRQELKHLYTSPRKPEVVDVEPGWFLTYRGRGKPGGEEYSASIGALYSVAYTLKFHSKARGRDFAVMPLEGLWWIDEPNENFYDVPQERWNWKSMIRQPDFVTPEQVQEAKEEAMEKKGLAAIDKVVFEKVDQGLSAQIMHTGPYSEERPTIEELHDFIREEGYRKRGEHHEIYLSDPNRTAPERLRTIIRQPIERA